MDGLCLQGFLSWESERTFVNTHVSAAPAKKETIPRVLNRVLWKMVICIF